MKMFFQKKLTLLFIIARVAATNWFVHLLNVFITNFLPIKLYLLQPVQTREEAYDDYVLHVIFYYDHTAWLQNGVHDLNETLIHDMFIHNMYNSRNLFQRVQRERASGTEAQKQQYVGERFISSIQGMIANTKPSGTKFGCPVLGNCPSSHPQRPGFNRTVCPTSLLNYDAYYDDGILR